ncbi:MAG: OmpH family outer membrane protein [Ignavibacteria bacterium]|nr:OmpH family outer membrane protein [Ignavibacteria bacterium]
MKKLIILFAFFFISVPIFAQVKIGFINSEAIMKELPEAQDAQRKLDNLVQEWQAELRRLESEWKMKYDAYDRDKLIMSDQTRAEKEKELVDLENRIMQYREQKFGQNGELFQKQEEFMKPIQNKIFTTLEKIAKEEGYDFVFDKSGEILLLYANEKYDLTNKVLQALK